MTTGATENWQQIMTNTATDVTIYTREGNGKLTGNAFLLDYVGNRKQEAAVSITNTTGQQTTLQLFATSAGTTNCISPTQQKAEEKAFIATITITGWQITTTDQTLNQELLKKSLSDKIFFEHHCAALQTAGTYACRTSCRGQQFQQEVTFPGETRIPITVTTT